MDSSEFGNRSRRPSMGQDYGPASMGKAEERCLGAFTLKLLP